jgi:hypothetical protein
VAAFNTLASLQKTQDSMNSTRSLEAGVVSNEGNTEETLLAFETQAKQFEKVQNDFEEYMDRLKEDIDARAEEFGHIEYYDARLQDGHSNELAVASSEVRDMDERRKALTVVNPLLAKKSALPPKPQVEELVYEHLSLNLPIIAKNALEELASKALENEVAYAEAPEVEAVDFPLAEEEISEETNEEKPLDQAIVDNPTEEEELAENQEETLVEDEDFNNEESDDEDEAYFDEEEDDEDDDEDFDDDEEDDEEDDEDFDDDDDEDFDEDFDEDEDDEDFDEDDDEDFDDEEEEEEEEEDEEEDEN